MGAEKLRQKSVLFAGGYYHTSESNRSAASATRTLFEAALDTIGQSVWDFHITLELDNIATIQDLIRKDLGVSILPKSVCEEDIRKGKLCARPIQGLSMERETRIVFSMDFHHPEIPRQILSLYDSAR